MMLTMAEPVSLLEVQQDLVSKVVPRVVQYLRESLAKEILLSAGIKSCQDIKIDEAAFQSVKNALR